MFLTLTTYTVKWLHHSWILIAEILTPSLRWRRLKMAHQNAKFETRKPFCFLLAVACGRSFSKTRAQHSNRFYRTGKYTVCRRVRASFGPQILQAEAVKGLRASEGLGSNKLYSRSVHQSHSHWRKCTWAAQQALIWNDQDNCQEYKPDVERRTFRPYILADSKMNSN